MARLRGLRVLSLVVLGAIAVPGCAPQERGGPERSIELTPCHLEGLDETAVCGTLDVPLDRAEPDGRTIALRVAVVPARREPKPDPVFLLAGGPGQGAVAAYGPLLHQFRELNRDRDLVLVDQRGTGESSPLRCEREDEGLQSLLDPEPDLEKLSSCRDQYEGIEHYLTPTAMDDLDQVRQALGYPEINLIGGSYGTRAALVYARRHSDHVRTMVLDGVAPVNMAIPQSFAEDAQVAFDRLVSACAQDEACSERFPDPAGDLQALLESLEGAPRTVTVEHPRTGAPTEVTVTRDMVALGVRGLLYAPTVAALLPLALGQAREGDFAPLIAQMLLLGDRLDETMSEGLTFSVLCAEDLPFIDDAQVSKDLHETFVRDAVVATFRQSCKVWNAKPVEGSYREPVSSDTPTLVLSGELDPVTPPRWAALAAETLGRSRSLVVPGAGHGTVAIPCVTQMVTQFIETADPEGVDAACLDRLRPPAFFLDPAGPLP